MKKTYTLTHAKIKYPRLVEKVKHDVKRYLTRERNKALPENFDVWDFDCKFGHTEAEAKVIKTSQINACIDEVEKLELTSFYLEILAKPGLRIKNSERDAE